MSGFSSQSVTLAISIVISWATMRLLKAFIINIKNRPPYPPGPRPKFLIGNMFDLPSVDSPMEYVKWEKRYNSPLLHAEVLGNHILIVNGLDDAIALFERPERARIYSDKPALPILDLIGTEINIGLMPYGEKWRNHRRVSHQNFNVHAVLQYEPVQAKKVRDLFHNILNSPERFHDHNKLLSTSVTLSAMYGYEAKSVDDPCIVLADEALRLTSQLVVPGGSMINDIPVLRHIPKWFPGAYSRKLAAKSRALNEEIWRIPIDYVKKTLDEGTFSPSLVANFYEKKLAYGASEEEEVAVRNTAYTAYGAGSDTMGSITYTFVYLMILHPDVQKRAHDEIDKVIGSNRLPTLADRKSLPYVEAIYREVLRLYPPLPIGLPRITAEDDYYNGYYIPKGTTVLTNIWAMSHSERIYSEPYRFNPERHLNANGDLDGKRTLGYGFGRRSCVGKPMASNTAWLMMASILYAFNITKAKDREGNDIKVNDEFETTGILCRKQEFKCDFHPRSAEILRVILEA